MRPRNPPLPTPVRGEGEDRRHPSDQGKRGVKSSLLTEARAASATQMMHAR